MFCSRCGREIPNGSSFCLYCGAPVRANYYNSPNGNAQAGYSAKYRKPKKHTNGWGVTGFVFSLLGIFLGAFYGVVPFIAFICSVVGVALRHRRLTCNALAAWGLVLSIISLIGWILFWVFAGGFFSLIA